MSAAPVAWLALLAACTGVDANGLQAGRVNEFVVELTPDLRKVAGHGDVSPITHARVTIAVPANFDAARDWPIMVVCATTDPGYNSSRALLGQYAPTALDHGWLLVAADPRESVGDDGLFVRYALDVAALAVLKLQWPAADRMPLAFGGFSGGAKCSGWLAATFRGLGRDVAGIYLAGVNEDTVVQAARDLGVLDDRYRRIPVFLQSGERDRVATPADHRAVRDKLERAGFENVRIEHFDGPHAVEPRLLGVALDWFRDVAARGRAQAAPPATVR